jgi:hypothetical protein
MGLLWKVAWAVGSAIHGVVGIAAGPDAEIAEIRVVEDSLFFYGRLSSEAATRVREALASSSGLTHFVVDSVGGDVEAGMEIGDLIHERGLNVRVSGQVCLSSCANYVFLSGRTKIIDDGALVLWHGSMIQEDLMTDLDVSGIESELGRPMSRRERRSFDRFAAQWYARVRERQETFYARRGIDPVITVVGQRVGCDCDWTLSAADMARYGVKDVFAPADYGSHGYGSWSGSWQMLRLEDAVNNASPAGN